MVVPHTVYQPYSNEFRVLVILPTATPVPTGTQPATATVTGESGTSLIGQSQLWHRPGKSYLCGNHTAAHYAKLALQQSSANDRSTDDLWEIEQHGDDLRAVPMFAAA